ncbi:MAG: PadR family transcriptional regulator [Paludibacteraceae bacterium]|nr:PadR family transcriptional regulator [Paludibacteraceae bacterium]
MIENIKSQMRKGILEYCILSIINQQEAYTSDILETLKKANLVVVEGTVYPLLTRLKNNGILSYRWEESPSGPPRKYFCLTEDGEVLLAQLQEEWEAIKEAIERVGSK